jgi:hypothetical protein
LNDIKITPLLDTLYLEKIDDATYFSKKYSNYISNSRLGLINPEQGGSPEAFFNGFKPIYSSSLDIGTAVHSKILQKDLFNIVDSVDKPTGKMGAMADELFECWKSGKMSDEDIINAAKKIDYYKGELSPKRIAEVKYKCEYYWQAKKDYLESRGDDPRSDLYLDYKSRSVAYACISAIENSKSIQNLLHPTSEFGGIISENELAILLDIKIELPDTSPFILKLKSKVDNFTIDPISNIVTCNDIKTLGRIVSEMDINIQKYHYNRELAMYSYLLALIAKKHYNIDNPVIKGNYLVVSTIPNYYTKVVPMTKKMFIEGFKEFKYLLTLVAKEVATNHKDFAIWL